MVEHASACQPRQSPSIRVHVFVDVKLYYLLIATDRTETDDSSLHRDVVNGVILSNDFSAADSSDENKAIRKRNAGGFGSSWQTSVDERFQQVRAYGYMAKLSLFS